MHMNKGVLYGILAYGLWGVLPVYWKLIQTVPALEIIAHRMVWSFVFVAAVMTVTRRWQGLRRSLSRRRVAVYALTAVLLSINWLTYVWAVNHGYIVESSLGYFINPLVNVLLGVVFLRERLRTGQWAAVGLAALGVGYLTVRYGALPWIALTLAFSFALYGLIKKTASLDSIPGFTLETGLMFLPALGYLLYLDLQGRAAFGHLPLPTTLLLAFSGVVTGLPLLLFGSAARRIPLSLLGFLQYLAPTLQFLIGVLVYGEDFSSHRVIGFSLIWLALALYSLEGALHVRMVADRRRQVA